MDPSSDGAHREAANPSTDGVQHRIPGGASISPAYQHANLGITSVYLQGIDSSEIIATVHSRPAPVISASAGLIVR
jgi:hypothetical protein